MQSTLEFRDGSETVFGLSIAPRVLEIRVPPLTWSLRDHIHIFQHRHGQGHEPIVVEKYEKSLKMGRKENEAIAQRVCHFFCTRERTGSESHCWTL